MSFNLIMRDSMAVTFEFVRGKDLITLRETFSRYEIKLPIAGKRDMKTITDDFVYEMQQEITKKDLIWNWTLYDSIRTEPMKDGFYIPVAIQGLLLEFMRPHKAPMWEPSPFTGQRLGEWALDKFPVTKKIPHVLMVHPHPWMSPAFVRAENKIVERLKEGEFHKTMEKRGR